MGNRRLLNAPAGESEGSGPARSLRSTRVPGGATLGGAAPTLAQNSHQARLCPSSGLNQGRGREFRGLWAGFGPRALASSVSILPCPGGTAWGAHRNGTRSAGSLQKEVPPKENNWDKPREREPTPSVHLTAETRPPQKKKSNEEAFWRADAK